MIADALQQKRYETARRIGFQLLRESITADAGTILALHDALMHLADIEGAIDLLSSHQHLFADSPLLFALRLASDYRQKAAAKHYRMSKEEKAGYSVDEFIEVYRARASEKLEEARQLARTESDQQELTKALVQFGLKSPEPKVAPPSSPAAEGAGILSGRLLLFDGTPAGEVTVTLGLHLSYERVDPATFTTHDLGYRPRIAEQQTLQVTTSAEGRFEFARVPAGTHEFLSATLRPDRFPIATHFLARAIEVPAASRLELGEITLSEWQSAPPASSQVTHCDKICDGAGEWSKAGEFRISNPFHYHFPRQLLRLPFPAPAPDQILRVVSQNGESMAHQSVANELAVIVQIPSQSELSLAVYTGPASAQSNSSTTELALTAEEGGVLRIDTGPASFYLAGDRSGHPPILAVRGCDGLKRGQGRFVLPPGVEVLSQRTEVLHEGPVLIELAIRYELSNQLRYTLQATAVAGESCLLVHEVSHELNGAAFEFSLREFSGGRGFLHWNAETGSKHWTTLQKEDEVVGKLPESVPWWVSPQGFGYAMTPDSLAEQDYIAVFTIRRGEWIDRKFERIAQGPIDETGRENRELDWPYPEMVGSTISMITAETSRNGDAWFRFRLFDGERRWGLLVSTLDQNDGDYKEISSVQHANSSPRLQEFKDWQFDLPDQVVRPHVVVSREKLIELRAKSRSERFQSIWTKIREGSVPGPTGGLTFAIECDPVVAWRKRIQLLEVAQVYSRMTLLGRDWSDIYSPVGGRPITQWAEDYDMIAASGVFTAEEERLVRAFFLLMGHMFMEPDFMNWKFNGRNANFEADRVDIVGTVGMVFAGHPDAEKFLRHATERTFKSLTVYCAPNSGKWYENPACYYLHASKCRMNIVYHLASHGRLDISTIPRLKEFLSWGIVLLTPPQPVSYEIMKSGGEEDYLTCEKIRKVPPIGDHAGLGRWLSEHYAFMARYFTAFDPAFAEELMQAYFCSSGDGRRLLDNCSRPMDREGDLKFNRAAGAACGNLPLLFTTLEENHVPAEATLNLSSQRLEGFGAVLRTKVNTSEEGYLLVKQGPGGYRYHRTEGSFLFFAKGRPLVYDGGEAGETWRHSTLSFYDTHMPLAAGRVERYYAQPGFQFVQGIHSQVIRPGKPVYLSDSCEHELVEECYRRFRCDTPAVTRSFAWVGDDYLVIHDDLELEPEVPTHWNLQVVADSETGDPEKGLRFAGRFGVDLSVHLPGQTFGATSVRPHPIFEYHARPEQCFSMRHLQLSRPAKRSFLAVLAPVLRGRTLDFRAESLLSGEKIQGVKVSSASFEDILFFSRPGMQWSNSRTTFSGHYGAIRQEAGTTTLVLMGEGALSLDEVELRSSGPNLLLNRTPDGVQIQASGKGVISVAGPCGDLSLEIDGEKTFSL